MAEGEFAIYQTATGVTAVTNPVQRQIMEALEGGDRQLPELVELTGKAKPTLSGTHMKELLNRELIVEKPHPTDSRRKVYGLLARRIGSSDIPVGDLRRAVEAYAKRAPGVLQGMAVATVLRCLAVVDGHVPTMVRQARAIGAAVVPDGSASVRDFTMTWARFLEEEGIAQHLQIDLEGPGLRSTRGPGTSEIAVEAFAALMAGLFEGAAEARGLRLRTMATVDEDKVELRRHADR